MLPTKLPTIEEDNPASQVDCNPIDGISIKPQTETLGLTHFEDEAAICAEIPASTSKHYSVIQTEDVQSLKEYLARPRVIVSGAIPPGAGGLGGFDIRSALDLRNSIGPVQWDRLRGAVGFRATMKLTLVVSATPFHQGILTLSWQYATHGQDFNLNARANHLPLVRNLPHVQLDISENTMASLEIPYVSQDEYWPIDADADEFTYYGTGAIMKQTNFRVVVGQISPEYTLYMSLHDVEIIGAVPYTTRTVTLQAGDKTVQGLVQKVSDIHKEAKKGGLVSKALDIGASAARAISYVPPLSAVGGTADWFLRSAAKVASSFGYSKPLDENKPKRVNRISYAGDTHIDVPYQGWSTTPFQTNKLATNSVLGCTDDDQMAFDYVLTKPSLIYRGQMSEGDGTGTVIYGSHVSPNSFWYRDRELSGSLLNGNRPLPNTASLTTNAFYPSTLLYVGSNFRYWRGDIKFKITFSKSKMHGGRVMFSFCPITTIPAANLQLGNIITAPEAAAQPNGMVTVFDLRDGNSFEFVVPYIALSPYMTVDGATGAVTMTVVSPLRAPGVCASTIDFLVEVSAEPGFDFACFCPSMIGAMQPSGPIAVTYQSGEMVATTDDSSQNVMGEKFNSLKQLAMIPSYTTGESTNNSILRITLVPWYKYNGVPVAVPYGSTASDTALYLNSPAMRVASMYSFANGATNYQMTRDGGASQNFTTSIVQNATRSGATFTDLAGLHNLTSNTAGGVIMPEVSESSRWTVPSFSRFARIPLVQAFAALGGYQRTIAPGGIGTVNYNPAFFTNRVDLVIRNSSGATRRFYIARSAADDARASQYIGPPPCALYQSTAITSPVSAGDTPVGTSVF